LKYFAFRRHWISITSLTDRSAIKGIEWICIYKKSNVASNLHDAEMKVHQKQPDLACRHSHTTFNWRYRQPDRPQHELLYWRQRPTLQAVKNTFCTAGNCHHPLPLPINTTESDFERSQQNINCSLFIYEQNEPQINIYLLSLGIPFWRAALSSEELSLLRFPCCRYF
jgi:hypothetical protein